MQEHGFSSNSRRILNWLLAAGILLRLAVFFTTDGFNPDDHFQVIRYIAENRSLPISNQFAQSYHPPLYHATMAALYSIWPSPGPIHFVSLLLAVANLCFIRRLLDHPLVMPHRWGRIIAFALICCLPQFVMYGNFISNDPLTMLVGTAIFWSALRYIEKSTFGRLAIMGILVGVGLLTKGTFLATGPALVLLVILIESRRGWLKAIPSVLIFCLIWVALGSYKYIENVVYLNRPIVHNLERLTDQERAQLRVWHGWPTVLDANIVELLRRPVMKVSGPFSYPLLLYGTFWYPHIPDSSYRASIYGYDWVGSAIYAAALVPTLVFLIGLARSIVISVKLFAGSAETEEQYRRARILTISWLLLLSNAAVVIAAGIKFDVWWCFQSRLCFQSMLPAMVLFGLGMESLEMPAWLGRTIQVACWLTIAACVLYFVVEIAFVMHWLPVGTELQP